MLLDLSHNWQKDDRGLFGSSMTENKVKRVFLLITSAAFICTTLLFALDRDSGAFLTISKGLLEGKVPYRDLYDHKPPGIYYVLTVPLAVSKSLWSAKLFLALVGLITIFLSAKLALLIGANKAQTEWVVTLVTASWVIHHGYTLETEAMIAPLVVAATILSLKRKWFISGILVGFSITLKQPAALFLVPMAAYATLQTKKLFAAASLLIGSLLPLSLIVGVTMLLVGTEPFLDAVILSNLRYSSLAFTGVSLQEKVRGYFDLLLSGSGSLIALSLLGLSIKIDRNRAFIFSMIIAGIVPLFLYPVKYYLLQVAPIVAIASAIGIKETASILPNRAKTILYIVLLFPILVATLLPTAGALANLYLLHQLRAGQYIASITQPNESILVVPAEPQYYFLSQRYPPGRDIYLLAVNHSRAKENEMIESIKSGSVRVVAVHDNPNANRYSAVIRSFVEGACSLIEDIPVVDLKLYDCSVLGQRSKG